jgi:Iap family predicted aminopeptidase
MKQKFSSIYWTHGLRSRSFLQSSGPTDYEAEVFFNLLDLRITKQKFSSTYWTHGLRSRSFLQSTAKFGEVQSALSFLLGEKRQAPATKLSFTRIFNWIVYEEMRL